MTWGRAKTQGLRATATSSRHQAQYPCIHAYRLLSLRAMASPHLVTSTQRARLQPRLLAARCPSSSYLDPAFLPRSSHCCQHSNLQRRPHSPRSGMDGRAPVSLQNFIRSEAPRYHPIATRGMLAFPRANAHSHDHIATSTTIDDTTISQRGANKHRAACDIAP